MSVQNITNWGFFSLPVHVGWLFLLLTATRQTQEPLSWLSSFCLGKLCWICENISLEKSVGLIRGCERRPGEDLFSSSCDNFPWTFQIIQVLDTCQCLKLSETKQPLMVFVILSTISSPRKLMDILMKRDWSWSIMLDRNWKVWRMNPSKSTH